MRNMNSRSITRTAIGAFLACAMSAAALAGDTPLTTVRVVNGLVRPIYVTHAPDDFDRIFIIEKQGRIRIVRDGVLLATPFLDIDSIVGGGNSNNSEQGLLGLAFHPQFQSNGFFFVDYTSTSGNTVIRRYSVSADPDVADASSSLRILRINQPFSNHNGGWIHFGPDGMLYIAMGDGGSACDPSQRAQDITDQLLGKILRIDIDGDDFPDVPLTNYAIPPDNPFVGVTGDDEIWVYGMRNPWRDDFDPMTGDLYLADVGQGVREEIDFLPGGGLGGENFGWDCREGTACSTVSGCSPSGCNCNDPTLIDPVLDYTHGGSPFRCSITGGVVYRGCAIPDLSGTYFYADFCSSQIWTLRMIDGFARDPRDRTAELAPAGFSINSITSFGRDAFGEIYICDQSGGEIFKIVPDVPGGIVGMDCNANGIDDACDILAGATDNNANGIPDECECVGDLTGDNTVGLEDLSILLSNFGTAAGANPEDGDLDGDGDVDLVDLAIMLSAFGDVCG